MFGTALISLLLCVLPVVLCSRVELFPFGPGVGDAAIQPDANIGSHTLTLGSFLLFGYHYTEFYVHSDGVIGVENEPPSEGPQQFPLSESQLIAPFWAGSDTTQYSSPAVFYRETEDLSLRLRVQELIASSYNADFVPTALFIATWDNIGYQAQHLNKLNTFQAVLAFSGEESYVLFLYRDIQWSTADSSGGTDGLGGTPATVGLNLGDDIHYLLVPGSGTSSVLNLDLYSNNGLGVEGLYLFKTHTTTIAPGPMYFYSYGETDEYVESPQSARLQVPVTFFGRQYSTLQVSMDSIISLGPAVENATIVVPFWLHQGTSGAGSFYLEETTDEKLRAKAQTEINLAYDGRFVPTSLFIATWISDGETYTTQAVPMFQVVIASTGSESYVMFLYKNLPSLADDVHPVVGLDNGDRVNYFILPAASVLDLTSATNIGIEGQFIFGAGKGHLYTHREGLDFFARENEESLTFSSESFAFSSPFVFGGDEFTELQIFVDGYIKLGISGGVIGCPNPFPSTDGPIIAGFWTDADTRNGVGYLSARVTTDVSILSRAVTDISLSSGNLLFNNPVWALIATWDVSSAQSDPDINNIFQVVLVSDGLHSHVLHIYDRIQWSSGGSCGDAIAGANRGQGVYYFYLPGSGTSDVLNYANTSDDVGLLGLFIQPYISSIPPGSEATSTTSDNGINNDEATISTSNQPHNSAYSAAESQQTAADDKLQMYKLLINTFQNLESTSDNKVNDEATTSTFNQPHNSAYVADSQQTAADDKSEMYQLLINTFSQNPEYYLARALARINSKRPVSGPHM